VQTAFLVAQADDAGRIHALPAADPTGRPVRMELDGFLADLPRPACVRVLAGRPNCRLITALGATPGVTLELANPAAAGWGVGAPVADPAGLVAAACRAPGLARNRRRPDPSWPPSLGGTQRPGPVELATYALADLPPDAVRDHPVYRRLAFIRLDPISVGALLGLILDPRWFVDPADPGSLNRLGAFLRLDPKAARHDRARFRLAYRAWHAGGPPADLADPAEACWRRWYDLRCDDRAIFRVTVWFVRYLRAVWLDTLYALRRPESETVAFAPEHFFAVFPDAERYAAAYRAHLATLSAQT
jgi:hypothetical protein